jgi:hypothetical protein
MDISNNTTGNNINKNDDDGYIHINTDISNNTYLTKININYNTDFYYYVIIILVVYIVLFLVLRLVFSPNIITKGLDAFFILFILFFAVYSYLNYTGSSLLNSFMNSFLDFLNEPVSIFTVFFFILFLYLFVFLAGIPMTSSEKPIFIILFENVSIILFIILLIIDFFKYVLNINIINLLTDNDKNIINTNIDISNNITTDLSKNEVFNISNNLYTYDDAKTICKAYGARLATYDDIEASYNDGAEWGSYGWSEGQMAFFPTQKATWSKLQNDPIHKNDLGRPGINGGYFANPEIRFGVNCYGVKPTPSPTDLANLNAKQNQLVPKTPEEILQDKKLQFWEQNKDKLLVLNSFNTKKWSEY